MKNWRLLVIIKIMLLTNIKTHANVLEYYGASYCQIGLATSLCPSIEAGAQAKAAALLALSGRTQFSMAHISINHQFKKINNVVELVYTHG